jgi:hypothetical protein
MHVVLAGAIAKTIGIIVLVILLLGALIGYAVGRK